MTKIYYPIVSSINNTKVENLKTIFNLIEKPEDQIISYIASSGGEVNSASTIISVISNLPIKTIAFSGSIVYSKDKEILNTIVTLQRITGLFSIYIL